jgi:hypothetical protein
MRKRLFVLMLGLAAAFFAFAPSPSRAQDNDDFQTWNMLIVNKSLGSKYRGYFEIQPRFGDDSTRWSALLIRPAVGYELRKDMTLWLGYANVTTYAPRQQHEDRIWQQLLITTRRPRFDLINRTRLEQRLLPGVSETSHRLRHFVRVFYPLDAQKKWAFVGQEELFINLNSATPNLQSGYDQNRAFVGLGYTLSKQTRLEMGYQYVHVRVPTAAPDRNLHTLLTMLHINL